MVRCVSTFRRCVNTKVASFGGAHRLKKNPKNNKQTNKHNLKKEKINEIKKIDQNYYNNNNAVYKWVKK